MDPVRVCQQCGHIAWCFSDEIEKPCSVCNGNCIIVDTLSIKELYLMTASEKEQFAINYVGHDFDPELKLKRIEYDANKRASIRKRAEEANAKHPECPTCHSRDTKAISGLERGVSIISLGLLSKKINKSFKCNNCGYTW